MPISQETQVRPSEVYDDQLAPAAAESAANLQEDLNYLRSVLRAALNPAADWFATPATDLAALAAAEALNTAKVSADGSIDTHSDVVTSGLNAPTTGEVLTWNGTAWVPRASGCGGSQLTANDFVPTGGQTVFILAQVPAGLALLDINGVLYRSGLHFTVAGTILTFNEIAAGFSLSPSDRVTAYYVVCGGVSGQLTAQDFSPTNGQTVFILAQVPTGLSILDINGVIYREGLHFTVAGTTLTFNEIATGFSISSGDRVTVYSSI